MSSVLGREVNVRVSTHYEEECRETFKGRATLAIWSGDWHLQTYPTAKEMRELAAELIESANQLDAAAPYVAKYEAKAAK